MKTATPEHLEKLKRISSGQMTREEYIAQNREFETKSGGMIKDFKPKTDDELNAGYDKYRSEFDGKPKFLNSNMADLECPPGAKCAQNMGGGVTRYKDPAVMFDSSRQVVAQALNSISSNGTRPMLQQSADMARQSGMDRYFNGSKASEDDNLPVGPGYAYMTHLFRNQGGAKKVHEQNKKNLLGKAGILTNAMEGVKNAVKMLGIAAETNTDGLPIGLEQVYKAFFGDKELDEITKGEFIREIQDGVSKFDRKKVRKFVNHDGSLTWELLNDDKTIMDRFTFGDYKGTPIFAQGGYKNFAELLRQAKAQLGNDTEGEFDAIRGNYK